MLFTTWKCAGGHGPEREELKVMLQQSMATKIPHSYICTLPGPRLPSCEVSSNSCYCRNIWITHPGTSLLGPHARLDWRGTSPGTDAFSSLELLTERTARSFPDRQISLTRSSPVLLYLPWLHGNLRQRGGCIHSSPTSAKGQNISSVPGWTCWLSVEWHTHTASGCLC